MQEHRKKFDYEYLVIGAGIAGLAAAYALQNSGKKTLVLEQNQEPGGRIVSKSINGSIFNLGAGFIMSSYKNIIAITHDLNIRAVPRHSGNIIGIKRNNSVNTINPKKITSAIFFKGISLLSKLRILLSLPILWLNTRHRNVYRLQDSINEDNISAGEYMQKLWGKEGIDFLLDPIIYGPFFHSPYEFSKALFLNSIPQAMGADYFNFKNGLSELPKTLAKKLNVHYQIKAERVERKTNFVLITAKDLRNNKIMEFSAKHLIIAVPGNEVLSILHNPKPIETNFFQTITYASAITVQCSTSSGTYKNYNHLLFPSKEQSYISTLSPLSNNNNKSTFAAIIRDEFANKMIKEGNINNKTIAFIIQKALGPLPNLEILIVTPWLSAIPKFKPGYITKMCKFQETMHGEKQIFYCGDYLSAPYIEGAFTSGLRIAEQILNIGE